MVTSKEWTEKVMVPGDGSMAWEARMLVGLATWTAKSPGLVAGVGVQRSAMSKAMSHSCVVEGVPPATWSTEAQGPQAIRSTFAVWGLFLLTFQAALTN